MPIPKGREEPFGIGIYAPLACLSVKAVCSRMETVAIFLWLPGATSMRPSARRRPTRPRLRYCFLCRTTSTGESSPLAGRLMTCLKAYRPGASLRATSCPAHVAKAELPLAAAGRESCLLTHASTEVNRGGRIDCYDAAPNNGMRPTRDTIAFKYLRGAGGRVMPGVRLSGHRIC